MQDYLRKVRKTSNMRTLCNDQARLVGLNRNVQQFKSLTNAAILILKAEEAIELTDDMTVICRREVKAANANPIQLEAAYGMARVFAGEDVVSIYRTLGFKSL